MWVRLHFTQCAILREGRHTALFSNSYLPLAPRPASFLGLFVISHLGSGQIRGRWHFYGSGVPLVMRCAPGGVTC